MKPACSQAGLSHHTIYHMGRLKLILTQTESCLFPCQAVTELFWQPRLSFCLVCVLASPWFSGLLPKYVITLVGLGDPYGVSGVEPRLLACKTLHLVFISMIPDKTFKNFN